MDCPEKRVTFAEDTEEVQLCLLNGSSDRKQKLLVIESLGHGLLDCGCTRTVTGILRMENISIHFQKKTKSQLKRVLALHCSDLEMAVNIEV